MRSRVATPSFRRFGAEAEEAFLGREEGLFASDEAFFSRVEALLGAFEAFRGRADSDGFFGMLHHRRMDEMVS
jgi:hypothetical protein